MLASIDSHQQGEDDAFDDSSSPPILSTFRLAPRPFSYSLSASSIKPPTIQRDIPSPIVPSTPEKAMSDCTHVSSRDLPSRDSLRLRESPTSAFLSEKLQMTLLASQDDWMMCETPLQVNRNADLSQADMSVMMETPLNDSRFPGTPSYACSVPLHSGLSETPSNQYNTTASPCDASMMSISSPTGKIRSFIESSFLQDEDVVMKETPIKSSLTTSSGVIGESPLLKLSFQMKCDKASNEKHFWESNPPRTKQEKIDAELDLLDDELAQMDSAQLEQLFQEETNHQHHPSKQMSINDYTSQAESITLQPMATPLTDLSHETWCLPDFVIQRYRKLSHIFQMHSWQAECLTMEGVLNSNRNIIVSAPTSSGKTLSMNN